MPAPSAAIGSLTFAFETFTHGSDTARKRTTKVAGTLSKFTPFAAMSPLSHFEAGDTGNSRDLMEGYDKGHLVMVSNSGVSAPENIVAMYPCFNQAGGMWRELEQRIANYFQLTMPTRASPRVVVMTVGIEYAGLTDPRFPTTFIVTIFDRSDQGGFLYFKGAKLENFRIAHLPTQPAAIDPRAELDADLLAAIEEAEREVVRTGWLVEQLYSFAPPNLAPLAEVPFRPYAMLDYLWLQQQDARLLAFLTAGCRYRNQFAAGFHERQKQLIRVLNAGRNGGSIKSDYPGDTTESLILGSGQRSAQIDHVFPYSASGGNLFSNALVASGAYNNRMSAAAPAAKWLDRSGGTLALYSTTRHI